MLHKEDLPIPALIAARQVPPARYAMLIHRARIGVTLSREGGAETLRMKRDVMLTTGPHSDLPAAGE